mmetsp:Transcript_5251/g.9984  ORF Transcript_5251/g.9984 Transcript_5251/m.9984 type:complete len:250 (+) Transcript_5251:79-828(+)
MPPDFRFRFFLYVPQGRKATGTPVPPPFHALSLLPSKPGNRITYTAGCLICAGPKKRLNNSRNIYALRSTEVMVSILDFTERSMNLSPIFTVRPPMRVGSTAVVMDMSLPSFLDLRSLVTKATFSSVRGSAVVTTASSSPRLAFMRSTKQSATLSQSAMRALPAMAMNRFLDTMEVFGPSNSFSTASTLSCRLTVGLARNSLNSGLEATTPLKARSSDSTCSRQPCLEAAVKVAFAYRAGMPKSFSGGG